MFVFSPPYDERGDVLLKKRVWILLLAFFLLLFKLFFPPDSEAADRMLSVLGIEPEAVQAIGKWPEGLAPWGAGG